MTRQTQKNMVRPPLSGDILTDWFFRQFIGILNSERVRISRKKRLFHPDRRARKAIRGLMDPDIHPSGTWVQILINPAKNTHRCRDEEVETLIHELAHILMPKTGERAILSIENHLTQRFTAIQRRYLKAYIPRHEVKRYPRLVPREQIAIV